MGNSFAFDQLSGSVTNGQGDAGQQQQPGGNLFQRLHSGLGHLVDKAKTAGHDVPSSQAWNEAQQYGRNIGQGLANQAQETAGAAQRVANGQGTDADRQRLETVARGALMLTPAGHIAGAANILERTGALNQVGGALQHSGVAGLLGNIFHRGAEQITRLDTTGFVNAVRSNWDVLDPNHTGVITRESIQRAEQDQVFAYKNAFMLKVLTNDFDKLSALNNDQWFSSNKGITREDIDALATAKAEGTGFSSMKQAVEHEFSNSLPIAGVGGGIGFLAAGKAPFMSHLGKGALFGAAVLAAGAIYGAGDYYLSRKDKLEEMMKELG